MTIYFASIKLQEQIHTGCLGFTSWIYEYVAAATESDVAGVVETWCQRLGLKLDRVTSVSVADIQDPAQYCFPEQIIQSDGTSSHRTI